MSSEIRVLRELGLEFERLASSRRRRRFGLRRSRPLALVAVLLLGGTAAALAATGVILPGSPVRPSERTVANAGDGVPVAGESVLLPLRVADPAGGPPWGMRVVHTTRSVICVQVGRIYHGQLGQLGIDGAFGNDGRFHQLPADILPNAVKGITSFEFCDPPGTTHAFTIVGLEASAASNPAAGAGVSSGRRVLSFGLLGPHAASITYTIGSRTRTEPALAGLGAYLIVQRYAPTRCPGCRLGEAAETNGDNLPYPQSDPAGPNGPVTAIRYRYAGKICIDNANGDFGSASNVAVFNQHITQFRRSCGLSEGPPPRLARLPNVREPLRVHLQTHGRLITGAQITFPAPIAITKATQSYLAWVIVGKVHNDLTETHSNIQRGALVHLPIQRLLSRAATRTVKVEIDYDKTVPGPPGDEHAIVGTITIHEPAGTHPAP